MEWKQEAAMGNLATVTNITFSGKTLGIAALAGTAILTSGMMQDPLILAFLARIVLTSKFFARRA